MPSADSCCTPIIPGATLSRQDAEALAVGLKALADPVRLQIVSLLAASADHAACVCDITPAVGLAQPTVSHHLKVLRDAGLVTREARGTWAWFHLVPERLAELSAAIATPVTMPDRAAAR